MWNNNDKSISTARKIGTVPTAALDALHNAEETTVKFRTVLLTLLIGNRTAASLLFFGLFFGIFVAQNVGVVADEKAALGGQKNAPYSINDKTQENASDSLGVVEPIVSTESVEDGALERTSEPLPLGRRAFERVAEEDEERRRSATRTSTFETFDAADEPNVGTAGGFTSSGEETTRPSEAATAPRLVRQNAYSGNVVFYELSNGLRVLLKKTTERRVGIRIALRDAGTLGEREAPGSGVAALTASLVAENANALLASEAAGADVARLRWRVDREGTVFAIDAADDEAETAFIAATDALWRSTFDEERLERAVRASRRRIETAATDRETFVENLTAETVYIASPFREPIDGRLDLLEGTTVDEVRAFYASRYAPNRTVLAIAGPLDPEETLAAIVARSRNVRRSAPLGTAPTAEPRQTSVRDAFVEGTGTTATLVLAWPTVERSDPDAAAFEALAELLTGGANARLTRKVVDGAIPALDVAARARLPFGVRGFFEIRSTVAPENWTLVEAAIRAELRRLAEEPLDAAALEGAKKRIETARAARERDPVAALEARATALAATGDPDFEARWAEAVRRVDAETLRRVVRERLGDVFCRIAVLPPGTAPRLVVPERFEPSPILLTSRAFANGLRVVAVDSADERLIDVRFVALAGALVETRETAGRTALLAEMLDKGSKHFSRAEVARFFDSIGSRFEVEVGRDVISFGATVLREDFDETFEILLDAATNPLFDEEEFERAKARRLAELERRSGSVDETLAEIFANVVPSESTFAVPIAGTRKSLESTTLDDLRAFGRRIFSPQNMIVGVDGALEGTTATNAAFALLEAVPANPNFQPIRFERPNESPQKLERFKLARGANVGTALFAASVPPASRRDDWAALFVLQAIWAGGFGDGGRFAELFKENFDGECEFRVDLTPGPASSYMTIKWTTEPQNLPEATRRVFGAINATLKSSIPEEECRRAKKQIFSRRKGRYVGLKERTFRLILDELYRVAPETPTSKREREFEEAILRTTAADVVRVARKYWGNERAIWAGVSPLPYPGMNSESGENGESREESPRSEAP
ncbi:MAG: insulinase family protein [Thermoguttaceae bacterium]|nr:insulinase family protein [Thermoguttaceae bacterium]